MAAVRAGKELASRAVHIRIHPRPANMAEGRGVLRVLQRFGQVVVFKSLRVCSKPSLHPPHPPHFPPPTPRHVCTSNLV